MTPLRPLLAIAFIESFATILVERGVYYYAEDRMAFGPVSNLSLGLGIGICYVIGALISHKLTRVLGEKRLLLLIMSAHVIVHTCLAVFGAVVPFLVFNFILAVFTGLKWPIVESYVSAGRTSSQTARAVGLFSVSWALSVPLGMAAAGKLIAIDFWPLPLFAAGALVNLISIGIILTLESNPVHLSHDSPHRPAASELSRLHRLLTSSRWSMFTSYMLLFLVTPLMPAIFKSMDYTVETSAVLASLVELVRAATFIAMLFTAAWHGRPSGLFFSAIAMPIGFLLMLFGTKLPVFFEGQPLVAVLTGELIFGVAAGFAYYAALYYAMIHANASVESGGAHESLVGLGFAVGPAIGLMGYGLAGVLGNEVHGMLAIVAPVLLICLWGAVRPLRAMHVHRITSQ